MSRESEQQRRINESFQHYHLAQDYRQAADYVNAIEHYRKTIEYNPSFKAPYTILSYMSIGSEQLERLIQTYQQVLEADPTLYFAWCSLGDALTQQKRYPAAQTAYRNSCYHQATQSNPQLARLNWDAVKRQGPDFMVIGAARCGTSSFYEYLHQHPNVLLPCKKELNFFPHYVHQGLDWYLSHFPAVTDRPDLITGEATTAYLDSPIVPLLLQRCFPNTKIIVLLRNPIDRAVSWHYHKVRAGRETRSLPTAIAAELQELSPISIEALQQLGYQAPNNLLGGLYVYKLQRWIDAFGAENLLVLRSEDLYEQPDAVMGLTWEFLGLPPHRSSQYAPLNQLSYPPLSPDVRATLQTFFAPHTQRLEAYFSRSFHWS